MAESSIIIKRVYQNFLDHYGPRHWWPADSPFEVMVGAILTQNTSWTNVERALINLKQACALDPETIVSTHPRRLATWLKPCGYFNVKAKRLRSFCKWLLDQGGVDSMRRMDTSSLREVLLEVHGVGPETADDMLLYALQRPVFVVDAYTRRIFSRLGIIQGNEHYETIRALFESVMKRRVSDYNEYHALIVLHGKSTCRPNPLCSGCCVSRLCAFRTERK